MPPRDIRVKGWLENQLKIQANGLHGNLDKVWPDVKDSKWLGGDREGWERFPYFLDGFIPLAYLLGDKDMISRADKYMNALLSCQDEDGCFYPKGDAEKKNGDIWSLFLILKVLVVYERYSGDKRIESAVERCLKFIDGYICGNPLFNWAAARWYEPIIAIKWLYDRKKEEWLVKLARRLKTFGMDFTAAMPLWKGSERRWTYETHVVNIAMALKAEALFCELTGDKYEGLAKKQYATLDKYHGTAYRHFNGDECLAGSSPVRGSELCGVVEAMYSYEWLTAVTGDAFWGDILEGLAFNGLPAALSEDTWAHQYDQQVNQIACTTLERTVFGTNNEQANVFGLEPHYGCCTANFGQGFPKFTSSAYMRKGDELVIVSPVPAEITLNGNTIKCKSEYPFRSKFTLISEKDTSVLLRVPKWAEKTCGLIAENGWAEIKLSGGVSTSIDFKAEPYIDERLNGNVCVRWGALLFALPIAEKSEKVEYVKDGVERKFPYCDYSITPAGEWRYALVSGTRLKLRFHDYANAFSRTRPPVTIEATFAPVKWETDERYGLVANEKTGDERTGENVELSLSPYGATTLRITETALIK